MKKILLATTSCLLATALMTGAAYAKSDNAHGAGKTTQNQSSVEQDSSTTTSQVQVDGEVDAAVTTDTSTTAATVDSEDTDGTADTTEATDTTDTTQKHGKNGYKGLLKAIENVKDKPAGAVIADHLLQDYGTHLTDEMKAELEGIQEADAALSAAADMLDQQGSVTEAVYAQEEAIQANVKNLDLYKKLGKLNKKLGKTGVQLFVNGEEPSMEVKPFIREGNTLVPFRAISEALKADVSWDAEERSVTVTRDGVTVKLYIDSKTATVNGEEVTLEVPAAIEDGSTVVPVRFVSEALKAVVKWEDESDTVVIYEE
ncbi:copper amine oxidase N-terminal domain-containing protein [Paenibacillus hexagrammi]|uniref:Copper amine oxidase N-terminal domain-containing protein n=1 Tax=Paenibacillus hexagrammi TaxID=2908839 RepID=A0ABY3SJ52_9BACL|nr:copper amine oxidase N-terminal domain-containing protein [Paenibacillus sp. YPD9-1]UJF33012.1 copper amine oxidase N-terminal domain-containing protein [Paenibacillus sp. YPD9-1]